MSIPEITIDGIVFRLLSYNPHNNERRGRLIFSSTVDSSINVYAAYQSKSDIGLWRLCLGLGTLEKGADYVQSSLIHIELQRFFNHTIEMTDGKIHGFEFEDTSKYISALSCNYKDPEKPGNSRAGYQIDKEISRHLTDIFEKGDIIYNYNGKFEFCQKPHCLMDSPRQITENSLNRHFDSKYNMSIPICGSSDIKRDMLTHISEFLERNYKYQSLELIYPGYRYELQDISSLTKEDELIEFDADIYVCNFINGTKFYFIKFNFRISEFGSNTTVLAKSGFGPLLMLPPGATITKFGTYSEYINLGAYICKIFDYYQQCSDENTAGRPKIIGPIKTLNPRGAMGEIPKCDVGTYIYIGDRYQSLYPYKYFKLREDGSVYYDDGQSSSGGTRKKSRRTRVKKRNLRRRTKTRNV
jgi:hypothetical protein